MGFSIHVEAGYQTADAERPHSSFLSVLLLGLSHEFGYVFNWRTIVVIEAVALAFDAGLVG